MFKDSDDLRKESAEQRAIRMWSNYDLTKRFLEEVQKKESISKPPKTTPEIAEVIETEYPRAQAVTRFERRFICGAAGHNFPRTNFNPFTRRSVRVPSYRDTSRYS